MMFSSLRIGFALSAHLNREDCVQLCKLMLSRHKAAVFATLRRRRPQITLPSTTPSVDLLVMQYNLVNVHLQPHETARTQASSTAFLPAGSTVVEAPALLTALIASEKGKRCDHCHSVPVEGSRLSKCSGCAAYWYCGTVCANLRSRICNSPSSWSCVSRPNETMASSSSQDL